MSERPFAETLAGAQNGEEQAVTVLWRTHHPRLLRVLASRHAADDVDDLASEVWLRVTGSWHRFVGDESDFRAWFFTIAHSVSVDSYRRASRRRETPTDDFFEDRQVGNIDETEVGAYEAFGTARAVALLAQLPREQGEAVALRVIAGLDTERVAEIMGKRPGNVRVLQHRGLRRLAELIDAERTVDTDVTR